MELQINWEFSTGQRAYVYMHLAGVGVCGNWTSSVRLFWGLHGMTSGGGGVDTKCLWGAVYFEKRKDAGKTKEKNFQKPLI